MKRIILVAATMVCLILPYSSALAAELQRVPPVPAKFKDIKVLKPDPTVPKEIAEFLGEWEGVWLAGKDGRERHQAKIIIYEASSQKIKFLYGRGAIPRLGLPGIWFKQEVEVRIYNEKPRFSFQLPSGVGQSFYLENGFIGGFRDTGGKIPADTIEMKRIK